MHREEIIDILDLIIQSISLIEERFSRIDTPEDFVNSSDAITILDAISMRLQVIGESVKKIEKIDASLLRSYSNIEWVKIAKFRDLVSHHYTQVDHEIVYDICERHIDALDATAKKMRIELDRSRQ